MANYWRGMVHLGALVLGTKKAWAGCEACYNGSTIASERGRKRAPVPEIRITRQKRSK